MVRYVKVVAPVEFGAPVKEGRSLSSKLLGRLMVGAVAVEEERNGERTRLKKVAGPGPEAGWVSARLVEEISKAAADQLQQEEQKATPLQGKSLLAVAEAEVQKLGATAVLAAAEKQGKKDGAALIRVAVAHLTAGSVKASVDAASEAEQILRQSGNKEGEASAVLTKAAAQLASEEPKQAWESAVRAMELFRPLGDRQMEASAMTTIANAQLALGEPSAALVSTKEALHIFRQIGDKDGEAAAELTMTDAYIAKDGFDKAAGLVAEARTSALKQKGDKKGQVDVLLALAAQKANASLSRESIKLAIEARELAQAAGDSGSEIKALKLAATTQMEVGDFEEARATAEQCAALCGQLGDQSSHADALTILGHAQLWCNEPLRALESFIEAKAKTQDPSLRARALEASASAHLARDDAQAAVQAADEAAKLLAGSGGGSSDRRGVALAKLAGARARAAVKSEESQREARKNMQDALEAFQSLGDQRGEATAILMLSCSKMLSAGGVSEAVGLAERARALFLLMGDGRRQGLASHAVAKGNLLMGDVNFALQTAMQAAYLLKQAGDAFGEASALHTAVHAMVQLGRYHESLRMAKEMQGLFRKAGSKTMEQAAAGTISTIQEALPKTNAVARPIVQAHIPSKYDPPSMLMTEEANTVIWSAPLNQQTYIVYCLELLKLVDQLKTQTGNCSVLVTTQGVMGRQTGQEMASNWFGLAAHTVWGLVRTVRLESPRLKLSTVDLPCGASVDEITECLRCAQTNSGPRNEIAFTIDRRNLQQPNKKK